MKKFRVFATLLVVALCATTVFTSCDNDDDNPLVGTTWKCKSGDNTLIFRTGSTGVFLDYDYNQGSDEIGGSDAQRFTYTFNDPTVVIRFLDGYTIRGTVSGSTMTFTLDDDEDFVFTKQ